MSSNSKYHSIGSIVDQFLVDNDLPDQFFAKALGWAQWGLRELHLDTKIQDAKTCLLDVTDRKTATLPSDYVDWTKVGVKNGQYVITIGLNEDLSTLNRSVGDSTVRGLLSQNLPNGLNENNYIGYYFLNYNGSNLYSLGGGLPTKGFFKIHNNGSCREMLLDYDVTASQIYLEYISDGFDPCRETIVNVYFHEYVRKWLEFEYESKNNPARNESSIFRKGRELFHATSVARARGNVIDKTTLLNITRGSFRMTPKV